MKKITINVPDNCEVQVVRKEAKFKKGDIVISRGGLIAIYEKTDFMPETENEKVLYYSTLYNPYSKSFINIDEVDYGIGEEEDCEKATTFDEKVLLEALKQKAKNSTKASKVLKEVFNIEVKPVIRTYQDLVNNDETIDRGYWIGEDSSINEVVFYPINQGQDRNIAASKKVVKSMLAMSMISMLMPHYGGAITDEEWKDGSKIKYTIGRFKHTLEGLSFHTYYFLAFHTKEQRDDFLKYNERLVKDYLMID